ncbi:MULTISPECIES: preprotein translocase subunit SecG [Chelatococcus]|uniref:Protein-export membrane protein SecG n=1 Tax=Chelatococcus caeni TaxID=1348468 RepID=A0A840BXI7_9HYPH|nr:MULTISPECIES: preprotein translocase subunit SecG [Chelatococcus]ALA18932.1 preprotein translocase subunit SecG [Chelatococcus sp. CO-6]MBB4016168.1 preprotein translocase subunit SecG [Chelatococcus caeni]
MLTVLIVVHLIIVLALVGVVLLQRSEGGGLGMGGGGVSGFMTGRGQANVLTRTTAILAAAFFVTSLLLSVLAGYQGAPSSVIDRVAPGSGQNGPSAPASGPGVLEELQRLQGGPAQGAGQAPSQQPPAPPAGPQVPSSQ